MKPYFTSTALSHPPMAFSASSSLLRHQFTSPLRHRFSHLRFLSVTASPRKPLSVRARRRDEDEGNGSLVVNEKDGGSGRIVPTELHKEATEAYMAYAMSVLLGRALPDVRDGLKPVHRRILFAMHELGLSSRKPYKKCARVVGEVLGKFHPHGDTAVYDSLVRMAQDFSLRCPLIQGHGNFGSVDADPPAAMRYTECRLDGLTEAMLLADLEQNTVDFLPNFDNSQKEPSLLPARLPTLLLNGSSGIAVGMATNIPPHNIGELVDVLCVLIHNPEATLQELLEYMPGPDFPTGGLVMGNTGILEAYRTGRGRIVVRGKTEVELLDSKTKRTAVIIKEIPYQTNKSSLVEKIAELVENKSLDGISDIRDESDRSGMRIVIELKRGSDPSIVLNNLYRLTALQSSFSCNMIGILDGQPKLMGLKELLQAFLDFRCSVVERRAKFKLSQAQERRHVVEGIVVGLDNMDAVIRVIKEAPSNAMASTGLRNEFSLSEKQAEAILDISLRRLTRLERQKFVTESKSLMEQISKLQELLSSRKEILQLIEEEAVELKNRFSTPRRSMLEDTDSGQLEDIDVIPNEEMLLAVSEKGYVKRMKPNTFNLQNRGTIGKSVGKLRVNDAMSDFIVCHAHDHVLYFSDKGIVYSARAYKIPECTRAAAGTPLVQILSLADGERITSIIPVSEFAEDQFLLMLTVNGYIKKVSLNSFSSIRSTGIIAIQLVPGDELKWVRCCTNGDLVAMASQNGMVILCSCEIANVWFKRSRMREDERNGNWFAVESKLFEFTMEGEGKKAKCFITERSRGIASWIRFGIEGMNKLLLGVEECCRVFVPARRPFEWRENGRYFRLESKENSTGRFLLCSVTDAEGKTHRLVFPEGKGILNGWTLLVEKIRGLGFKALQENKPMRIVTKELSKGEEKEWTSLSKNKVTWGGQHKPKDDEGAGSSGDSAVWMDVGDCVFGKELGPLQFCLVGKWKTKPNPYPVAKVMEVWFRDAWRLNEEVLLAALNKDLFLLEFDSPEKAKWVLESGRRSFKGGDLQLEWWSPESGCIRHKDLVQEAWIRVVGLPLHLWTLEILRKIGNACGGFVAVDKNTEMKTEVKWARMLIKMVGNSRPRVVNILKGPRSFDLQIWWEVSPWVIGVHPVSSRVEAKNPEEEEEEGLARATKQVGSSRQNNNDEGQNMQACKTNWGKRLGLVEVDAVFLVSGATLNGSGGAYA